MTNEKKPIEKPLKKKAKNLAYLSISFILLAVIVALSSGSTTLHLIKMNTSIPSTYGAQLPKFQQYTGYNITIKNMSVYNYGSMAISFVLPPNYDYNYGFGTWSAGSWSSASPSPLYSNGFSGISQIKNATGTSTSFNIYDATWSMTYNAIFINSTKNLNPTTPTFKTYPQELTNINISNIRNGYNNTIFVNFLSDGVASGTATNITAYPNCHLYYNSTYSGGSNPYSASNIVYECFTQKSFTITASFSYSNTTLTTYGIATPISNTLSFTSTLLYLCSNGEVQQAYTPLNVSILSPIKELNIPLQNSQITSISTTTFNSSSIQYGYSALTNGVLSISPNPFKNLPKIMVLLPSEIIGHSLVSASNSSSQLYKYDKSSLYPNLWYLYNGKYTDNFSYYWLNNISNSALNTFTQYKENASGIYDFNSSSILANLLFSLPYYNYQNAVVGYSQSYLIPSTNSTITGALPIYTTIQMAMPLSAYPLNVSDVIPKALNLTFFDFAYNKTIFAYTAVNNQNLTGTFVKIRMNKFNDYALTTINGVDYLDLNVSLNVSYLINTTHYTIGDLIRTYSSLNLLNGSLAYSVANKTFSFTTTENNQNLTLALYREDSLYKPNNFTTTYYLNSAHEYVSNQSNYLWYFANPVLYTDYFTAYVNSQPYTPYVKLLINKTNYSANSLTQNLIKTTLDSSTTTPINAYLYINGQYIKTKQIYFTTPAFNPCSAKTTYYNSLNFYYNASTNTIYNVSIGHNTNLSANKTAISTGGFKPPVQKVVSTGLGNAWFGISALGSFSFLLTTQLWYLVLMVILVAFFAIKMQPVADVPISILIVLFLGIGILTGILNPLFSFGFAVMLGYFAFTTFRQVFIARDED